MGSDGMACQTKLCFSTTFQKKAALNLIKLQGTLKKEPKLSIVKTY